MEVRKQWGFSTAGELVFGVDALKRLGKVVAKLCCKNPLIVSDPGVKEAGLLAKTLQVLDISGICYGVFDRGEPEPSLEVVLSAYEWAQGGNHDSVIAVGGGECHRLRKGFGLPSGFRWKFVRLLRRGETARKAPSLGRSFHNIWNGFRSLSSLDTYRPSGQFETRDLG